MNKIKIGLIGLGYFGTFHLKNLLKTKFELVGVYDSDYKKADTIAQEYNIKNYKNPDDMIAEVDAIDITAPTKYHFGLAKKAINKNKHVFVEKPMTSTSEESAQIVNLLKDKNVILQVGHIERYNPSFDLNFFKNQNILKIEANRFSTYNPRGTDVSVIFDLMIHDIDLVLALINSNITEIKATGIRKFGDNLEYANSSLFFNNGAIANLNASILHPYTERKMKLWTDTGYFEIDLGNKTIAKYFYSKHPDDTNNIFQNVEKETKEQNNQILDELNDFHLSISADKKPQVSVMEGHNAILVAESILNEC